MCKLGPMCKEGYIWLPNTRSCVAIKQFPDANEDTLRDYYSGMYALTEFIRDTLTQQWAMNFSSSNFNITCDYFLFFPWKTFKYIKLIPKIISIIWTS